MYPLNNLGKGGAQDPPDGTTTRVRQAVTQCLRLGGSRYISGADCEIPDATPHQNLFTQAQVLREFEAG